MSNKPGDWWSKSWNPIEGCTPISEACANCWAASMLRRFRGQKPGELRYYPDRIEKPYQWRKPQRIFCGSLTDLFQDEIVEKRPGFDILDSILTVADIAYRHTYIFLTKRPDNVHDFLRDSKRGGLGNNCWIGATIENQSRFNERIDPLVNIPADVHFLHLEPLLGLVDISAALPHVQWVVVGGENGPGARPMHPEWVRDIRDQCVAAGVKFWFKGWGTNEANSEDFRMNDGLPRTLEGDDLIGREWNELPEVTK